MTGTPRPLLLTVGGSPAPIVAQLIALQPENVHALVTEESADVWPRVLEATAALEARAGREFRCDATATLVPAHDISGIESAALAATATWNDWSLGYAGGTPAMSAGAFRAWRSGPGERAMTQAAGPAAWYVVENGDALVDHRGDWVDVTRAMAGRNLSFRELLCMNGVEPCGPLERWDPIPPSQDARGLRRLLWDIPDRHRRSERAHADDRLGQLIGEALATIGHRGGAEVYRNNHVTVPDKAAARLSLPLAVVTGFTLRLVEVLGYEPDPTTPARDPSSRPNTEPQVSVNWQRIAQAKEAMFAAEWKARQVGGLQAKAACLITAPGRCGRHIAGVICPDTGPRTEPGDLLPDRPWARDRVTAFSRHDLISEVDALLFGTEPGPMGKWLIHE